MQQIVCDVCGKLMIQSEIEREKITLALGDFVLRIESSAVSAIKNFSGSYRNQSEKSLKDVCSACIKKHCKEGTITFSTKTEY